MLVAVCVMMLSPAWLNAAEAKMPEFSLSSALDGKNVTNEDFKGKVLLVNFFATWCQPCRQEIPSFIKLQDKYQEKGFSVVGLSMDQSGPAVVAKLMKKAGINYPVLMSNRKTARGFGGIIGVPTSFLVGRDGEIVQRYTPGYVTYKRFEKDIESAL